MEINKQLADSAKAFFANYSAQSVRIPFINDALAKLVGELDKATQAIKEANEQSKISSGPIRDNLAILAKSIDSATEQAKQNADSSSKLARSLNIITFMLVLVGIIQVALAAWHH